MTYYEELIGRMHDAMAEHPHSTIAMAADTFEILASGTDTAKVARQMRKKLRNDQIPVIFKKPKKSETWIL